MAAAAVCHRKSLFLQNTLKPSDTMFNNNKFNFVVFLFCIKILFYSRITGITLILNLVYSLIRSFSYIKLF